jgi:hypothetical protein
VEAGLLDGGEDTSGLNHIVHAILGPGNGSRILLGVDLDDIAINDQVSINDVHLALVLAVGGVVLEKVGLGDDETGVMRRQGSKPCRRGPGRGR